MKQLFKSLTVIIVACFSFVFINAQTVRTKPVPWVSEKGYWMLESDLHTPLKHIIRFYNNDNILVHTENLVGVKLNINKRNVKIKLKKALEETLILCEQHKRPDDIRNYITGILK